MSLSAIFRTEFLQVAEKAFQSQNASLKSLLKVQIRDGPLLGRQIHSTSSLLRKRDARAHPPSKEPSSRSGRWVIRQKMHDMYEYTIKPLPFPNSGGRGPNGRIWNYNRTGGSKKKFRLVDWIRGGPLEDPPLIEKVTKIVYDPMRTANLALVASGDRRRYIIASQHMQAGDLLKSSRKLSPTAVRANEGDSYPVGSLAVGTVIHCLQLHPDTHARKITAAGTQGSILRKVDGHVIIKLPSKQEVAVLPSCTATVGRVCNVNNNKINWEKAGRSRWRGFKPASGLWHRKKGIHGRKIKPPRKVVYLGEKPAERVNPFQSYTFA